jgi:ComF family protein
MRPTTDMRAPVEAANKPDALGPDGRPTADMRAPAEAAEPAGSAASGPDALGPDGLRTRHDDRRRAALGERVGIVVARLRAELVAALAPPACLACRAPLRDPDAPLCAGCRRALPWIRGPRCDRCGLPAPCATARGCPAHEHAYARAWAPLAHEGPASRLVAALKFRSALPLAQLMAAQIAAALPPELLADGTALVPVPLHPARRRARGFDQAALIARALSARTGAPLAPCLRRAGAPSRQLGATRDERLAAGRALAIEARRPVPRRVLLVDDVHTTGATFDACARALRVAGAERVAAVAYVRALRR